jgi:hypothetical protein
VRWCTWACAEPQKEDTSNKLPKDKANCRCRFLWTKLLVQHLDTTVYSERDHARQEPPHIAASPPPPQCASSDIWHFSVRGAAEGAPRGGKPHENNECDITHRHEAEKEHLQGHRQREDVLAMWEAHFEIWPNISRSPWTALLWLGNFCEEQGFVGVRGRRSSDSRLNKRHVADEPKQNNNNAAAKANAYRLGCPIPVRQQSKMHALTREAQWLTHLGNLAYVHAPTTVLQNNLAQAPWQVRICWSARRRCPNSSGICVQMSCQALTWAL